jgi:hypothetical protein
VLKDYSTAWLPQVAVARAGQVLLAIVVVFLLVALLLVVEVSFALSEERRALTQPLAQSLPLRRSQEMKVGGAGHSPGSLCEVVIAAGGVAMAVRWFL